MAIRLALIVLAFVLGTVSPGDSSAQNNVVSYQGQIRTPSGQFTGTGKFKIALVTSTNQNETATATATTSGGFVTIINVDNGGSGYVSIPNVSILGGGGSGATATASIGGGMVTEILVDSPGSGYTSQPVVVIDPPPEDPTFTTHWSNDDSSVDGSEPTNSVPIPVNGGLFTLPMGDTSLPFMGALTPELFQQDNLELRIWFDDGENGFAALAPTQALSAVPYALIAQEAATVGGLASSRLWQLGGNTGTTGNTDYIGTADNQPLDFRVNNQRGLRLSYPSPGAGAVPNVIGGYGGNFVSSGTKGAVISGGGDLGMTNSIGQDSNYATIGGGISNFAEENTTTIGGGENNVIEEYATGSTIGGGRNNHIISGQFTPTFYSTIPGGTDNAIGGAASYAFAAGRRAHANHLGAFVWADSQDADFSSSLTNEFAIRADGGVTMSTVGEGKSILRLDMERRWEFRQLGYGSETALELASVGDGDDKNFVVTTRGNVGINTAKPQEKLHVTGNILASGTVAQNSDRNAKTDIRPVDPLRMLERVLELPLSQWRFREEAAGTRHVGPMAQDFHAAFGLGAHDTAIATVDADGVALSAIQGLNQKLERLLAQRDAEIGDLQRQVDELTQLVRELLPEAQGR